MFKKLALLAFLLCPSFALAQTCPLRPQNDNSNACASTSYADRAATAVAVSPANPTAQVGPSAVNGSSLNYMRSDAAPALANTSVTPGTYGSTTQSPQITIDAQGRITSASNQTIVTGGLTGTATVTGASTTFTSAQNGKIVLRSNTGSPMADTLPGTSPGILPANTYLVIQNNDTAGVLAVNVGTGATLKGQLAPTGYIYICPGQSVGFFSDGSAYWAVGQPSACVLQAATTFFAAFSGTASTNHGLTASSPLDPNQVYALAQAAFDLNGQTTTFQMACGSLATFTSPIRWIGPIPGQGHSVAIQSIFPVQLVGNPTTPDNCVVSTTGNAYGAIQIIGGADVLINGFKVTTTTGGNGTYTESATSQIENMDCGNTTVNCFAWTRNSYGQIVGANKFSGVNQGGILQSNSWISWETTATQTMAGGPVFSSCFACSQYTGSIVSDQNPTFSGATGASSVRYSAFLNGVINTGGGGASYYPGTVAGSTSTGGQYN